MKVGILGTGMGAYHAEIYKSLECVESITVFGRNQEKLNKLKSELGVNITTDINDILDDEEIELIDVCLPNNLHKEMVIKSLEKGKNVFCETPIANTYDDALKMKEAKELYKKQVLVNQFIKFEPNYEYLYNLIKEKTYGKLKALHIRRKTPPLWGDLGIDKISINLMIHELDLITWINSFYTKLDVFGISSKEGQCHVDAFIKYEDFFVEVQSSSMMPVYHPFSVGFEAIFEEATLEYFEDGYENRTEEEIILFTNNDSKKIELPKVNCFEETIKEAVTCCNSDKKSILDIDYAVESLKLALEIKNKLLN